MFCKTENQNRERIRNERTTLVCCVFPLLQITLSITAKVIKIQLDSPISLKIYTFVFNKLIYRSTYEMATLYIA